MVKEEFEVADAKSPLVPVVIAPYSTTTLHLCCLSFVLAQAVHLVPRPFSQTCKLCLFLDVDMALLNKAPEYYSLPSKGLSFVFKVQRSTQLEKTPVF